MQDDAEKEEHVDKASDALSGESFEDFSDFKPNYRDIAFRPFPPRKPSRRRTDVPDLRKRDILVLMPPSPGERGGHGEGFPDLDDLPEASKPVFLEAGERLCRHFLEAGREDQAAASAEKFGLDLEALRAEGQQRGGPDADGEGGPDGC